MKIILTPTRNQFSKKKREKSFLNLYREGFLMSTSNPIVFFAALFPLFIDQKLAFAPQVAMLSITYLVIDEVCLLTYINFASTLKKYLEDKKKIHIQNKIIGILLIFSGLMLSTIKRTTN